MIKKMNIIDKLHQDFVINKIKDTNWEEGTNSPLIVELDPTAVCDLACPGCISEDIIATGNSFSYTRLMEIGVELKEADVKGVIFIGGGEPLAHPASGDLIDYLGKHNISIGITTNGTFINRYLESIAQYSNWTRISIDASTQATFDLLRPPKSGSSKFDLIISNMRELAKIKKGKLGFSFLIRTEIEGHDIVSNIHEIYDAAVLAKDIGCDYFEIKPSYNYKNDVAHSLVKHDISQMEEAKRMIQSLEVLVDENFKIIKAITLDHSLNGAPDKQEKTYNTCPATELRTLITPQGVYVCPYWRGKDDFNIGNIKDTNFKNLWGGEQRKKVQKWLDPSKHCANLHCLRHETNLEVLDMINDIKNNKAIKSVEEFDRFI